MIGRMLNFLFAGLYMLMCWAVFPSPAHAKSSLLHTFTSLTAAAYDYFGYAVALDGDKALVGAYKDDTGAVNSGAAYLFDVNSGRLLQTFTNPTPATGDNFGYSVALDGDKALVGAYGDDTDAVDSGAVYLFDVNSGNLLDTITSPTPVTGDNFGYSVALDGDKALVGAYKDDTGAVNSGAAYLFDVNSRQLLKTITNPTPAENDGFGNAVTLDGDKALVGAHQDDTDAEDSGAAYLFDVNSGNLLQTITNPTPATGDNFGFSVALDGDKALVGAYGDDTGAEDSGEAYLYDVNSGNLLETFINPNPATGDNFGYSVALDGDKALVGAYSDDTDVASSGAAYLFDVNSRQLLDTITKPTPAAYDYFGIAVALDGDKALVGAYFDDTGAVDSGAVYLYDVNSGDLLHTFTKYIPLPQDHFGIAVALDGDKALVGAYGDDTGAKDSGAAYLYDVNSGNLLETFINPTPATGDNFGFSVALDGDKALVGASSDDTGAKDSGEAYLYDVNSGNLLETFINPNPATGDNFGYSVALDGDKALVGAYSDDTDVASSGAAYLFDVNSGNLLKTFASPTPAENDFFGRAVALDGDKALVGAPSDDTGAEDTGAVYLYDVNSCQLLDTFINPTPAAYDFFGQAVALDGDKALVGAHQDDTGAKDSGEAYLYDVNSGNLLDTFINPTPAAYDFFGWAVALDGDKALVSAYSDDNGAISSGAAYLYDVNSRQLLETFINPNPAPYDWFGYSVALDRDKALVGAYKDDTGVQFSGAAYLFDVDNLLHTITNPTPADNDWFGHPVALDGDKALVGAYFDDTGAVNSGAVHLFDVNSGNLLNIITNPTPAASDYFGYSVALDGDKALVGAYGDDTGAVDTGAAYLFDVNSGQLLKTFTKLTPAAYDYFGIAVALDGDKALVGAHQDDTGAVDTGAAYLFDVNSGQLLKTFTTPAENDWFGHPVALDGDKALVGADSDDTGARNSGVVHLFDVNSGNLLNTIINPTPAVDDHFGWAVALDGDKALVGADSDDTGAWNSGVAYLYDVNSGNLLQTFTNPTPAQSDFFGHTVALDRDKALVGAYFDDTGAVDSGVAYLFDVNSGKLLETFINPTPAENDYFGGAVALNGDKALVGASGEDTGARDSGAAYLFGFENQASTADHIVVDIDATLNNQDNPVVQHLEAGDYSVQLLLRLTKN